MLYAICFGIVAAPGMAGPYNYTGKLTDHLNEGLVWGMPPTGQTVEITLTDSGAKVSPSTFKIRGPRWSGDGTLTLDNLRWASGSLSGKVAFKNGSGFALGGVRFDIVAATEHYKGKDGTQSRALPVKEESPILFGDMLVSASDGPFDIQASGLDWKPETTDIVVTAKLSGLTYIRTLFPEHLNCTLDFDNKGRLLVGSGSQPAIYRASPDLSSLELVASTPDTCVILGVSPVDGSIAASWLNSHDYNLYTSGGDDKATISENGEVEGMGSWPSIPHYDGKGNLYLQFGSGICQMAGNKPAFCVKGSGQYDFSGYVEYDVAADGTIYVASESNVFRFAPGGKNGKKILQGPSEKLGRTHGINAIRVDPDGNIWVADEGDSVYRPRINVFDSEGHFIWTFGRGGPTQNDEQMYDSQVGNVVRSMAISRDGRVYVAGNDTGKNVLEFVKF